MQRTIISLSVPLMLALLAWLLWTALYFRLKARKVGRGAEEGRDTGEPHSAWTAHRSPCVYARERRLLPHPAAPCRT